MKVTTKTNVAEKINQLHSECCANMRATLEKAIEAGKLLAAQKEKSAHGNWLPWVKANLKFDHETARRYMRCFENRAQLNGSAASNLSIEQFARISEPNGKAKLVSAPGQEAPVKLGGQELPKATYERPKEMALEVVEPEPEPAAPEPAPEPEEVPRLASPAALKKIFKEHKDKPFTLDQFRLLLWEIATAVGLHPRMIDIAMANFEKAFK